MNSSNSSYAAPMIYISYWELFQKYYTPLLREVDILLKTTDTHISIAEAAHALRMPMKKARAIMGDVSHIDRAKLLDMMMRGDSTICRLYQRECACGSPVLYSPETIAYIYNLQAEHVKEVCREYGATTVSANDLPAVLDRIFVFIVN